jgi:hypothetical protein
LGCKASEKLACARLTNEVGLFETLEPS